MQFGTPEQDAFRRDFTINALFYNLNEGAVEDFTGRGLDDLRSGIIRTPLPPKETFMDGMSAAATMPSSLRSPQWTLCCTQMHVSTAA